MSNDLRQALEASYQQILRQIEEHANNFEHANSQTVSLTIRFDTKATGDNPGNEIAPRCIICTPHGCRPC